MTIHVLDADAVRRRRRLPGSGTAIAVTDDGALLAIAGWSALRIWRRRGPVVAIPSDGAPIVALAWSAPTTPRSPGDARPLLVALRWGPEGDVALEAITVDADTDSPSNAAAGAAEQPRKPALQTRALPDARALALSPRASRVALLGGPEGDALLVLDRDGHELARHHAPELPDDIALAVDDAGRVALAGALWRPDGARDPLDGARGARLLRWSHDGSRLLAIGASDDDGPHQLTVWQTPTDGRPAIAWAERTDARGASFDATGLWLASTDSAAGHIVCRDATDGTVHTSFRCSTLGMRAFEGAWRPPMLTAAGAARFAIARTDVGPAAQAALPLLGLPLALLLTVVGLLQVLLPIPRADRLEPRVGAVERAQIVAGDWGPRLLLRLDDDPTTYRVDHGRELLEALRVRLPPGTPVELRVADEPTADGRRRATLWTIRADGAVLLSYERAALGRRSERRYGWLLLIGGALASLSLACFELPQALREAGWLPYGRAHPIKDPCSPRVDD